MDKNYKRILSLFAWTSLILFTIRGLASITFVINMISNAKVWELIYNFLGFGGEAIFVSSLFLFFYDKFFWKIFNFWKIPILEKEYTGSFVTSYDDKERTAELVIKQSFLSIKIKMRTGESWSMSICENLDVQNGVNILTYTYFNKPDLKLYDRNKMHYGTIFLDCDNPKHLYGDYYTDRKTIGSITFEAKTKAQR